MRIRAFALLAAGLILLAGHPALGQVRAPSLVEGDLPAEDAQSRKTRPPEAAPGPRPSPQPVPAAARPPPPPSAPAPMSASEPVPASSTPLPSTAPPVPATPGVSIGSEELKKLHRPIEPVGVTPAGIDEAWQAYRKAAREQDAAAARSAVQALRDAMRELSVESLPAQAFAEVRASDRSLRARAVDDAVAHATTAVALAPDLDVTHVALARALLASDLTRPVPVLRALSGGFAAAARDPGVVRPLLGELVASGVAALLGAAAATILVLLLSRIRLVLHDFGHLPLLGEGGPWRTTVLALALLLLPLVLGLGPFLVLFTAALASWLYLSRQERIVVTVALVAVVAAPWGAGLAARVSSWQGTLGDAVHQVESGWPVAARVAELEDRAGRGPLPTPALLAIGRWHKRTGDLPSARRWFEAAIAADPRSAEAEVNLGNVHFLEGDLERAKVAYLAAVDRATDLSTMAAAQYDLSKVYLRLASVGPSSDARRKAQQADPGYLARHGSDEDFRANAWLVDARPSAETLAALADREAPVRAVTEAATRRVGGVLARWGWPYLPLGLVASLWGLSLLASRLRPSSSCDRCGRPACRRCFPGARASCGQCVNVFLRRNAVDPRDRERKEEEIRRHRQVRRWIERGLAVLGGGAGHLVGGRAAVGSGVIFVLLFLAFAGWFSRGLLPSPLPSLLVDGVRLAVAAPLFLLVYLLAVRDLFRRTREG